jgi:hypothetical protein
MISGVDSLPQAARDIPDQEQARAFANIRFLLKAN